MYVELNSGQFIKNELLMYVCIMYLQSISSLHSINGTHNTTCSILFYNNYYFLYIYIFFSSHFYIYLLLHFGYLQKLACSHCLKKYGFICCALAIRYAKLTNTCRKGLSY